MLKTAVAIRHVHFEDLGLIQPVLEKAGYNVHVYDAGVDELWTLDAIRTDLVVVLGGPIGAYDDDRYPFLADELRLLEQRLASNKPTLGICLGAQLMARVMGADVYAGNGKEIGWSALELTPDGRNGPLAHLDGNPVLHWHGDTFDLPENTVRLASTEPYANQAFSLGANVLGLQFHAEVDPDGIERWLIGHASEMQNAGLDPVQIRSETLQHGANLRRNAGRLFGAWVTGLDRR
jgi:GMP synthase (glutamine-hydrolysing)